MWGMLIIVFLLVAMWISDRRDARETRRKNNWR